MNTRLLSGASPMSCINVHVHGARFQDAAEHVREPRTTGYVPTEAPITSGTVTLCTVFRGTAREQG